MTISLFDHGVTKKENMGEGLYISTCQYCCIWIFKFNRKKWLAATKNPGIKERGNYDGDVVSFPELSLVSDTAPEELQLDLFNLQMDHILTLLEPPGFGDFCKKNSSFRLPYQRPSSSAHCARELFSGSNGSASLVDCTRKKFFCLGGVVFLWVTS